MTPTETDDEEWWDDFLEADAETAKGEPDPDWNDLEGPEPVEDLEEEDAPAPFDAEVWDRLPDYDEGRERKTRGVLVSLDGVETDLLSGTKGPSAQLGEYQGTGMHGRIRSHVEAHAGALMRLEGLTEATLYIDQVPCKERLGCEQNLPRLVPPGGKLTVYAPDYVRVVRGIREDQR